MHIHVVFPHQFFWGSWKDFRTETSVYLVEDPLFFYDPDVRPLRIHKCKLAYMVASMRSYYDLLRRKAPRVPVHYVRYDDVKDWYAQVVATCDTVTMYDPVDQDVLARYQGLAKSLHIMETPLFLMTRAHLDAFNQKHPHKTVHATFYEYVKGALGGILEGVKSTDKENRNAWPKGLAAPNTPASLAPKSKTHTRYLRQAEAYVLEHPQFSQHVGSTDHLTMWPITHTQARKVWRQFLADRLSHYGAHQDAIPVAPDDPVLFHSGVSTVLNNGLLDPREVLDDIVALSPDHAMNNIEGFVRQLIGWREYMRFLYQYRYDELLHTNSYSSSTCSIHNWGAWYNGTTGMAPLDTEIQKALRFGFSHHIVRLMMFLNVFILMEVDPHDIYRWFMEVVAMDAYDWVMRSNIGAMGHFYTKAMTKPYLSTSNYILRMSGYAKGPWCDVWDGLFYRFLRKQNPKGATNVYMRNLAAFKKFAPEKQRRLMEAAEHFATKHTR